MVKRAEKETPRILCLNKKRNTQYRRIRGLSLVELIVVLFIIALAASIVGVPVFQNAFSPTGGEKTAQLVSVLARHAQGWALERGKTVVWQINLSERSWNFSLVNEKDELKPLKDEILRSSQLASYIQMGAFQGGEQIQTDGIINIPFLPTGFSRQTVLYITDQEKKKTWTVLIHKIYGESKILEGNIPPEDLQDETDRS